MSRRVFTLALCAAAWCAAVQADVKPHPLFTDHVVLQRGKPVPVWGSAAPGEKVTVTLTKEGGDKPLASETATADDKGKWSVKLPASSASGSFTLTLKGQNEVALKDVVYGEVWLASGQSNMEWTVANSFEPEKVAASADEPMVRMFTVQKATAGKPQTSVKGQWQLSTPQTVKSFSAVGYFFARDLQKALKVPVGVIHTSWGGTPAEAWTSTEALNAVAELKHYPEKYTKNIENYTANKEKMEAKYKDDLAKWELAVAKAKEEKKPAPRRPAAPTHPEKSPNSASTLYNAMIAPLLPYAIQGAIWYQGESNASRHKEYRTLFPTMIKDWRAKWHDDFPFLFVQLAPFMKITTEPSDPDWARLREAQLLAALKLPKTGQAVITDVGEEDDIHPRKKGPVGSRLALAARGIAYGEHITYSGPVYKSMAVEGNKAVLSFDHVGTGLEARGGDLTGFTVAGEDGKFVNAKAEIRGETIVVSADGVSVPKAVRFGWANFPVVNLWNKDGLPASPFRTDEYEQKKK